MAFLPWLSAPGGRTTAAALGGGDFRGILRIGEKGDLTLSGVIKAGKPVYLYIFITYYRTAEIVGQFLQALSHVVSPRVVIPSQINVHVQC